MILTTEVALITAHDAGFRGNDLITIVCIGHAESGLNTLAIGHNAPSRDCPNGSLDRGWLQFNDCYHEDVSNDCAYDPMCSAQKAFAVVQKDGTFRQWSSFVAGTYKAFIRQVTDIAVALRLIEVVAPVGVNIVSIDVPRQWITDVSNHLGIADPLAEVAPAEPTPTRTYTVEQGDTLSGISHKLTNDENLWTQLYTLNHGIIGDNPDLIIPGQVLEIPTNWPEHV